MRAYTKYPLCKMGDHWDSDELWWPNPDASPTVLFERWRGISGEYAMFKM